MNTSVLTRVYFDGLCRLCSAEIETYRKMKGSDQIQFVDITKPGFNPSAENLDPLLIHREMHVRDELGQLHVGVPGFIVVWSKLPQMRWMHKASQWKIVRGALELGYKGFVRIRPYLPRKGCEESPYCGV